ncbi:13104_t:CDS:2, partial [Funneliformis mosseae]
MKYSHDDSDNDALEEDNKRDFEDNISEYSSDDLEENNQVNFDALEILKYQEKFQLSNVATNSLFKFLYYILVNLDETTFSTFSLSLYMTYKSLSICTHLIKYTACEKCCKLYNIADIFSNSPNLMPKYTNCVSQDFPNHLMSYKRNA